MTRVRNIDDRFIRIQVVDAGEHKLKFNCVQMKGRFSQSIEFELPELHHNFYENMSNQYLAWCISRLEFNHHDELVLNINEDDASNQHQAAVISTNQSEDQFLYSARSGASSYHAASIKESEAESDTREYKKEEVRQSAEIVMNGEDTLLTDDQGKQSNKIDEEDMVNVTSGRKTKSSHHASVEMEIIDEGEPLEEEIATLSVAHYSDRSKIRRSATLKKDVPLTSQDVMLDTMRKMTKVDVEDRDSNVLLMEGESFLFSFFACTGHKIWVCTKEERVFVDAGSEVGSEKEDQFKTLLN